MIQSVSKFFQSCFFYETSDEKARLDDIANKIIKLSKKIWIFKQDYSSKINKELGCLSRTQLKKIVENISKREEYFDAFKTLATLLSPKQLEDCLDNNPTDLIKNLLHEANAYLQQIKRPEHPHISDHLSHIVNSIFNSLEAVIDAFGIADFFHPMENRLDRRPPVQMIMTLLQFFSLVSTIIVHLIGPSQAGIIIGSMLFSICVLSLVYPAIRRFPSVLPRAENWTSLYRFGKLPTYGSRNAAVEEIVRTLIVSKDAKRHPLLIGQSGVGKTETIKSLIEAIEQGKYPELKGKRVFYIDAANLTRRSDSLRLLQYISEKMGRHRNQIILVIDKIHLLYQNNLSPVLGEQLTSLLDHGENNLPYVIGITDEKNYKQHINEDNNSSLTRKFKKIHINTMKPEETAKILNAEFLKHSPQIFLEPRIFETIVTKTKQALGKSVIEPISSSRVLSLALEQISKKQVITLEIQLEKLQSKLNDRRFDLPQSKEEIESLEQQICKLKTQLPSKQKEIQKFYQERDQLAKLKASMYKTAVKTAAAHTHIAHSAEFKYLVLLHQVLIPAREKFLQAKASQLEIKTVLDSDLIDKVLTQETVSDLR